MKTFDEIQGDVLDLRSQPLALLIDAVSCAESCETVSDLRANLDEAVGHATVVLEGLRAAQTAARKLNPTPA